MNAVYMTYPDCACISTGSMQHLPCAYAYACISALHMLCLSMCTCISKSPSRHRGQLGRTQYLLLTTQYAAVIQWECECDVGKAKCKAALQKELGFSVDPKIPLLGWIGRLDFQKGPDVVLQSVEPMAQRGCQVSFVHHASWLLHFHCSAGTPALNLIGFSTPKDENYKSCQKLYLYNLSNNPTTLTF